ncbi:MAG: DUF6665 family protein [Longimicrobiaceae bacterium]
MPGKPRSLPIRSGTGNLDAIEYEILQEKAAALSRFGNRLQQALDALRAFDARQSGGTAAGAEDLRERQSLVNAAGEALWYFVVQREVCGLRDNEAVLREHGVSREVWLRMGYFPSGTGMQGR